MNCVTNYTQWFSIQKMILQVKKVGCVKVCRSLVYFHSVKYISHLTQCMFATLITLSFVMLSYLKFRVQRLLVLLSARNEQDLLLFDYTRNTGS